MTRITQHQYYPSNFHWQMLAPCSIMRHYAADKVLQHYLVVQFRLLIGRLNVCLSHEHEPKVHHQIYGRSYRLDYWDYQVINKTLTTGLPVYGLVGTSSLLYGASLYACLLGFNLFV